MKLPFQRTASSSAVFAATCAEFPPIDGAEISAVVHGARMGGDFYHFMRTTPRRVVFGLLDVAGQRTENQHIIAATRTAFQEAARARFGNEDVNEADAMMDFCMDLNATIRRSASAVCVCAAFVGCYSEDVGTICYVNAGHTPGLLRHGNEVVELRATGLPLGIIRGLNVRGADRFCCSRQRVAVGLSRSCRSSSPQGGIRASSCKGTLCNHANGQCQPDCCRRA